MSVRWASMHPWSMSTPMINLALRLGKQRRPNCCNFKSKCARNSRLVPARPAKKSSTRDFQSTDSNFMATAAPLNRTDALAVPWTDAVRFIRQLSHDLRNHLNAIELQSAYITEFEATAETKAEIDRLRRMLSGLRSALQKISTGLGELGTNLIAYRASDFVEDLRKTIAREFQGKNGEINWAMDTGSAMLQIDPELLQQALIEVLSNAFQLDRGKGALRIPCKIDTNRP